MKSKALEYLDAAWIDIRRENRQDAVENLYHAVFELATSEKKTQPADQHCYSDPKTLSIYDLKHQVDTAVVYIGITAKRMDVDYIIPEKDFVWTIGDFEIRRRKEQPIPHVGKPS